MFERDYQQEMERISLSPDAMARIAEAMAAEPAVPPRRRPKLRVFLVAAALCVALTATVLAASPGLRAQLFAALGDFAPYSREIDKASAVDQDFEIKVLSAVTDQYRMKLYVQVRDLTGERMIDENTQIWAKLQRDSGEANVLSNCVAFDPDTHTALFEINEEREEPSDLQEDIRFWVGYVWPQVYDFATSEPLPTELISEEVLDCMTLDDGQVVLKPGQTPAPLSGFDKAELSSMGFAADGSFQVLVQLADGGLLEWGKGHRESLLLTNLYIDGEPSTNSEDIRFELDGKSYVGISFPNVDPEDLDKLTLSDAYGTVLMSEPIMGEWEVPFQVENYPVIELTLTGEAEGERLPTQLILTPLGAMVKGEWEMGYRGNAPFAVVRKDGTRLEEVRISYGRMSPTKVCVLGNWWFLEPLELEDAVSLELYPWYIPLTGEDAGHAYSMIDHAGSNS